LVEGTEIDGVEAAGEEAREGQVEVFNFVELFEVGFVALGGSRHERTGGVGLEWSEHGERWGP
jgi:hypothetical protein